MARKKIGLAAFFMACVVLLPGILGVVAEWRVRAGMERMNRQIESQALAATPWDGVRGAATLARSANQLMNTVVYALKTARIFDYVKAWKGTVAGYKIIINQNDPAVVDGVIYSGRVQTWRASDDARAMEFYYDNISDPTDQDGVLIRIQPAVYGSSIVATGMFEVRVRVMNGLETLTITYDANPANVTDRFTTSGDGYTIQGRVKMSETSTAYNIRDVTYVDLPTNCGGGAGTAYYTLAYVAKNSSPYHSTALWGLRNGEVTRSLCGLAVNPYNYGYFNARTGFERQGVTSDDGTHPSIAAVDEVYGDMLSEPDMTVSAIYGIRIDFSGSMPASPGF